MNKFRWGICGTSKISYDFTRQLMQIKEAEVTGVASRHMSNADKFASTFNCQSFKSYQDLFNADNIDIVYIAVPVSSQKEMALAALERGKHILVEKPFCMNAEEAKEVFDYAAKKNLFCMEGMWLRFNPNITKVNQHLDSGDIGKVVSVHIELGYKKASEKWGKWEDGKGALRSFGCYGISLLQYLFKDDFMANGNAIKDQTGNHLSHSILATYPDKIASFHVSEEATLSNQVMIHGTRGFIEIGDPFIDAPSYKIYSDQIGVGLLERVTNKLLPFKQAKRNNPIQIGLRNEAFHLMDCLKKGLITSDIIPEKDTINCHKLLNRVL